MTRELPGLTALRAFEAGARHRSAKVAAAERQAIHCAASRQIRRLEEILDEKLFHRASRGSR